MIITAHHGVRGDDGISVGLPEGQSVPATLLVDRDPTADLVVLCTKAEGVAPTIWAAIGKVRVGGMVPSMGPPWGVVGSLTAGAVIDAGVPI